MKNWLQTSCYLGNMFSEMFVVKNLFRANVYERVNIHRSSLLLFPKCLLSAL